MGAGPQGKHGVRWHPHLLLLHGMTRLDFSLGVNTCDTGSSSVDANDAQVRISKARYKQFIISRGRRQFMRLFPLRCALKFCIR